MKEKAWGYIRQAGSAGMIAGMIILLVGLYYSIIKAGIPYQDPPLDLQIQYEVHARIGGVLTGIGLKIAVCSGIVRFVLSLVGKKRRKK